MSKASKKSFANVISDRELATILAALRHFQEGVLHDEDCASPVKLRASLRGRFPQFDEAMPLNIDEVDALCQKLNQHLD